MHMKSSLTICCRISILKISHRSRVFALLITSSCMKHPVITVTPGNISLIKENVPPQKNCNIGYECMSQYIYIYIYIYQMVAIAILISL
jgi:hypothetical protein